METLRVYLPRLVIHGEAGMGQAYIGAAALHYHYHVENLNLGVLMGDSTRLSELICSCVHESSPHREIFNRPWKIVQLFVEAKRHQPSLIYMPSLLGWCAAVPKMSRSTMHAMLESLSPTDPILLLAIVDRPFSSLPYDVRWWFGLTCGTPLKGERNSQVTSGNTRAHGKGAEPPDGTPNVQGDSQRHTAHNMHTG
ncbi:hypothetical protein BU15DRAFT_81909 [Melanogaster broomeanus]|nr:hypothetical protein BU15DRAFT_81909 [Melanogaster broomeanus]